MLLTVEEFERLSGTPELMADYARIALDAGAKIIGGCCGTTPDHIAAMRRALDNPALPLPHIHLLETNGDDLTAVPERPTELARKLAAGRFVVTVEMAPPPPPRALPGR